MRRIEQGEERLLTSSIKHKSDGYATIIREEERNIIGEGKDRKDAYCSRCGTRLVDMKKTRSKLFCSRCAEYKTPKGIIVRSYIEAEQTNESANQRYNNSVENARNALELDIPIPKREDV